ncbi:hypothetical protein [Paenibacillus sp. GCM10027626]|uniref:hypothetical protein n=1 Tax=Paenibacillus sp. GCM10027626 TaxID=3273411 RepID=UPI00363F045B
MLRTLSTLQSIKTSTAINLFIYYLQNLPLLNKIITDGLYSNIAMKKALAVVVRIISIVWRFMLRVLYIGAGIYLPVVSLGDSLLKEEQLQHFIHIFFMFSFVVGAVSSAAILEPKREKYVAIKLFRIEPNRYMRTTLTMRYIAFFVYLLPVLLFFGLRLEASAAQMTVLAVSVTLWRIFSEYLHLKLFEKTEIILIKQLVLVWLVIGGGCIAAYAPLVLKWLPATSQLLLSLPAVIICCAVGLLAALQLMRYPSYRNVVDAATKRDDPLLDLGRMVSEAQKTSVSMKDSDYAVQTDRAANDAKVQAKQGYAYLNALFFARHRSIIRQPFIKRLAMIAIVGALGTAAALIFESKLANMNLAFRHLLPYLFISMYFLTMGEKLCRAMFYNCDISLMRYSFYRGAAYKHFRIRLVKIVEQNLVLAALLCAVLSMIGAAAGITIWSQDSLFLWISVFSLSLFFSVHHLFLYYIFQPYSTELHVRNPLYHFVNSAVSALSGLSIFLRVQPFIYAIIALSLTVFYFILAGYLVKKHGPRTFCVK